MIILRLMRKLAEIMREATSRDWMMLKERFKRGTAFLLG